MIKKFEPFVSSNFKCPVISYQISPEIKGIELIKDCGLFPCNEIQFYKAELKEDMFKFKIMIITKGNG